MRLIPVIDLSQGIVVHAVKGEREHYRPVKSVLSESADPRAVARGFRDRLGLREVYIADLDAIQNQGSNRAWITILAQQENMEVLLDAGAADAQSVRAVLKIGARKAVVGSETLASWGTLQDIRRTIPPNRLVFSLDMRAGRVLSRCPQLAGGTPLQALERLCQDGWREILLLDLARVGTGSGVDHELIAQARRDFPAVSLLAGGGIRDASDLTALRQLGAAGVLVASAFHQGTITREMLQDRSWL